MYCPLCKAEYRPGFTRCADCDVDLVEDRAAVNEPRLSESGLHPLVEEYLMPIWRGKDPLEFARLTQAFADAEIPFYEIDPLKSRTGTASMIPEGPGQDPAFEYEIRVMPTDREKAQSIVNMLIPEDPEEAHAEQEQALNNDEQNSNPAEDGGNSPLFPVDSMFEEYFETRTPMFDPETWNTEEATAECWSGEDASFAHTLRQCFLENGFGCRIEGDDEINAVRVLVLPRDERRAKEIVHEIENASSVG